MPVPDKSVPEDQAGYSVALSGRELLLGGPLDHSRGAGSGSGILLREGLQAVIGPAGGR